VSYLFNPPITPSGDNAQAIQQLHSYLYRMAEQLNIALTSLGAENFADPQVKGLISGGAVTTEQAQTEYNNLKSLIVSTAHTITSLMDVMEADLASTYLAISDFGTFEEGLDNRITLGAEGFLQDFGYLAKINAADEYIINSDQYIKAGLLYFDTDGLPRYGVAVGEKLTTLTVNGEETVAREGLAATFTSDRLSFWQNDTEVAWVSSNQLYIREINLQDSMVMGNWQVSHTDGFTIKWVGSTAEET